jgi:phosphopentomutase
MRALLIVIEGAAQPLFQRKPWASHGRVQRRSEGRDITAFHWEMAGVEVKAPFPVFERFPEKLVRAIEAQAGVEFIMKWARDSASDFDALVKRHIQTGRLILGATAGSGMHIMAHEQVMPLARLYATCRVARRQCDAYRLATVIARPLAGPAGGFAFAAGMHVYAMLPPRTVLNAIADAGITVEAVGSVADIFAGSGVTRRHRADSPEEGMEIIDRLWSAMHGGDRGHPRRPHRHRRR